MACIAVTGPAQKWRPAYPSAASGPVSNGKPQIGEAIYEGGTGSAEAAVLWFIPRHGMGTMFIHYNTKPDQCRSRLTAAAIC
jgi:hypothetical protein